jgi:hypothetical protein
MLRTIRPQLLHLLSTSKIKLVNLYRLKRRLSWKFSYHNIQITNKIRFILLWCLLLQCSHQHVSVAIAAIFRVKLLKEHKSTMWLIASSAHNN